MPSSAPAATGAVLYAKGLARVSAFYAELTGMPVTHSEPDFVVLGSALFQLTVVAIPAHIAKDIHIATPPVRREDTPIKLSFTVPSLARAREQAARHGGELNPAEREWPYQQHRVCDGHDPEGNVFQLRERLP
jgi:predicted enzyme related to lactoylglutathione lyase